MRQLFDMISAFIGLVVLSPLLALIAVAIKLEDRGPVFYAHPRVGRNFRPFRLYKFRTMVQGADQTGLRLTASGDARITRIGKCLRKTKMDEIPQLLNVLSGEMSLVGPRPELPEHVGLHDPQERRVLDLRPGLTGPASLAFIEEEKVLVTRSNLEEFYVKTAKASPNATHKRPR